MLDAIFGKAPDLGSVPDTVDQATRTAVNDRVRAAATMSDDFERAKAQGLIQSFEPQKINYGNEGVSGAIANKYGKISRDEVDRIKKLESLGHAQKTFKNVMGASQQGMKLRQLDKQREMAIRQRRMAEESQRMQLMGSILGIGGTIAGAYIAGPAGAMVGSQVAGMTKSGSAGGGTRYGESPMGGQ